jgi:hypothetical protein
MNPRAIGLLVAVLAVFSDCTCSETTPGEYIAVRPEIPEAAQAFPCNFPKNEHPGVLDTCMPWNCGGNSPIIGNEEYDLANSAESNYLIAGMGADPSVPTIQRGTVSNPTDVSVLGVENGSFTAGGRAIRPGETGWWIQLRERAGPQRACNVRLAEVGEVEPWYGQGKVPTYRLAVNPGGEGERALCRAQVPWGEFRRSDGKGPPPAKTWAALLVAKERYKEGATIKENPASHVTWFNISCAGTALAKMRMMGLDPEAEPTEAGRRDRNTAIKMLSASYCPEKSLATWTTPGVKLRLARCPAQGPCEIDLAPEQGQAGTAEAFWDDTGARCLSHTRLGGAQAMDNEIPIECRGVNNGTKAKRCEDKIRATCGIPRCTPAHWAEWRTEAINHPTGHSR